MKYAGDGQQASYVLVVEEDRDPISLGEGLFKRNNIDTEKRIQVFKGVCRRLADYKVSMVEHGQRPRWVRNSIKQVVISDLD